MPFTIGNETDTLASLYRKMEQPTFIAPLTTNGRALVEFLRTRGHADVHDNQYFTLSLTPAVQIEAAGALAKHTSTTPPGELLRRLLQHSDQTVVLHACRTVELLADPSMRGPMQQLADRYAEEPGDLAWFIRFSSSGYLSRM